MSYGRWDLENDKTLPHQRSRSAPHRRPVDDDLWNSGLKTLENTKANKQRHNNQAAQSFEHSTLDTTVEHKGTFKPGQESWLTENSKVLTEEEARFHHTKQSPYRSSRLLETETVPVAEWSAGQKIVPANRRRRFLTNNQSDMSHRAGNVQKESHLPSDGTWNTENFKTLEMRKFRRGHNDDWEGGFKVVPEPDVLAWSRQHNKVSHPHTWFDESHKTLPYEKSHKPNIYRFNIENTGWDSALYKTFPREEQCPSKYGPRARIAYAANHDWCVDGKVIPAEDQHPKRRLYPVAGTGWDSGLKTLPPAQQHNPKFARKPSVQVRGPGYWDIDNGKTMAWDVQQTLHYGAESNRHVLRPRHMDMVEFHQRMCRQQSIYAY